METYKIRMTDLLRDPRFRYILSSKISGNRQARRSGIRIRN